jgi:hypothetical protein
VTSREFKGIGIVETRPWAASLQFALQLLALPFLAFGGLGLGMVAFSLAGESGYVYHQLFGMAFALAILGVGAGLLWCASVVRRSLFLPGDWCWTFLFAVQHNTTYSAWCSTAISPTRLIFRVWPWSRNAEAADAASAANALVRIDTSTITNAKMAALGHSYLAEHLAERKKMAADHWAAAVPLLSKILIDRPGAVEWLFARAEALQHTSRYPEALADAEQACSLEGNISLRALSARINALIALGRLNDAVKVCDGVASAEGASPEIQQAALAHRTEIESAAHRSPTEQRILQAKHDGRVAFNLYHKTGNGQGSYRQPCMLLPQSRGHAAKRSQATIITCGYCRQPIEMKLDEVTFAAMDVRILTATPGLRSRVLQHILIRRWAVTVALPVVIAFISAAGWHESVEMGWGISVLMGGLTSVMLIDLPLGIVTAWKLRRGVALPIGRWWPPSRLGDLEVIEGVDLTRTITGIWMEASEVHQISRFGEDTAYRFVGPWRVGDSDYRNIGEMFGGRNYYVPTFFDD